MKINAHFFILSITLPFLTACMESSTSHPIIHQTPIAQTSIDTQLNKLIDRHALTGNPMRGKVLPKIHTASSQLGKDLFFSKALSGNRDTACVACHHPLLGGGDRLSLPIGVDASVQDFLGPGRQHASGAHGYDGGPPVPRNAPTTFNIAAWDKVMFHDGRIEALGNTKFRTPDSQFGTSDPFGGSNLVHAQARFPVTSREEMKGFSVETLEDTTNAETRYFVAARMGAYDKYVTPIEQPDYWLERFRTALNRPNAKPNEIITEQNISFLLGEYQRSQNFSYSPWRDYIEGDQYALSSAAKKGALLFYQRQSEGGANCVSCHSGDFFTDQDFHNIGMPQFGRGKGDGDGGTDDFGRFRETKKDQDKYAFRTPTLLNVEVTGPWGHVGAYTSLEAVIRHHANPAVALENYDYGQLDQPGIQNTDKLYTQTRKAIDSPNHVNSNLDLSDAQVYQLVEFMKSLTDPCTKDRECLAPWITDSNSDRDPNGDQLNAVNL